MTWHFRKHWWWKDTTFTEYHSEPLISGKSRLVKCCDLARFMCSEGWSMQFSIFGIFLPMAQYDFWRGSSTCGMSKLGPRNPKYFRDVFKQIYIYIFCQRHLKDMLITSSSYQLAEAYKLEFSLHWIVTFKNGTDRQSQCRVSVWHLLKLYFLAGYTALLLVAEGFFAMTKHQCCLGYVWDCTNPVIYGAYITSQSKDPLLTKQIS